MFAQIIAEMIVVIHFLFILFVVFGGLLLLKWRRLIWIHIPATIWGCVVEAMGWICPLTPLENHFRVQAGQAGYGEGFIAHYLLPIIYPVGLNTDLQLVLAVFVAMINCIIYCFVFKKRGTP